MEQGRGARCRLDHVLSRAEGVTRNLMPYTPAPGLAAPPDTGMEVPWSTTPPLLVAE